MGNNENCIQLNDDTVLHYEDLPLKKGSRKNGKGTINGILCVIYRSNSSRTALSYLMKKYPIVKEYFSSVCEFAPTILSCFAEHGKAYYFSIKSADETHNFIAFPEGDLWETYDDDFYDLNNLIRYTRDYAESDGNAFMDDYDLC